MDIHLDFYQELMNSAFDGIYQIAVNGRVIAWNKGAERITGFRAEQVVGSSGQDNLIKHLDANGKELTEHELPLFATLKDGKQREIHTFIKHAEGYRVSVLVRTIPIYDKLGKLSGAVEIFSDNKAIIAAYQRAQQVEQTVLYDALTGIGSRTHIEHKIKSAIEEYESSGSSFGVLFVDIDHFKKINDRHGHLTGDKVLRFVANAIRNHLRVSDSCGRWGGEEFLALVLDIKSSSLQTVAEKLRQLIEQSGVEGNDRNLKVTVSIGASMVRPGDTLQSLIQRADELMYKSKQNGRNRITME